MIKKPLVSVIIGNYNYGRFIAEAIDSVLSQTYKNFELIVVDDGSTDNSREIIESYGDKLIAIFQENGGQGVAFNSGFAVAKGEIICFLDADDYYYPEKIAKVVAAFDKNPSLVQISHCRTSVDADGKIIGRDPTFFNQGDVTHLLLKWGRYAWAVTSALAYKRWVLEKVLPFPQRPRGGDTYLTATVPFYGNVGYIKEPLMFYRHHGNNMNAGTNNLQHLIEQREDTAKCINETASKLGLIERFDIQHDADYRSLKVMVRKSVSPKEAIKIFWITLFESISLGHSIKDTIERFVRRGMCSLFPNEAKIYLRLKLRRYLRFKLMRLNPLASKLYVVDSLGAQRKT
ncbi:glycosyl transferase [Rivularia sp. PCC 7116]|uniref:glycosyltransferase family 2 protein n=1 Tax=Rivularia sp. PCC 7116 TaxID=373994 RepID=UPI00029F1AD8|nr:glycosyltransferase [Rivularia sp. PCC 7116]AFY57170.1 glycosyl transferase [Rivularia sp. PCC 7116]